MFSFFLNTGNIVKNLFLELVACDICHVDKYLIRLEYVFIYFFIFFFEYRKCSQIIQNKEEN